MVNPEKSKAIPMLSPLGMNNFLSKLKKIFFLPSVLKCDNVFWVSLLDFTETLWDGGHSCIQSLAALAVHSEPCRDAGPNGLNMNQHGI